MQTVLSRNLEVPSEHTKSLIHPARDIQSYNMLLYTWERTKPQGGPAMQDFTVLPRQHGQSMEVYSCRLRLFGELGLKVQKPSAMPVASAI